MIAAVTVTVMNPITILIEKEYVFHQQHQQQQKKSVSFNITKTEYIPTISNDDYTPEEKIATFYSRQEYQQMKDNIKHLVNFLRYQEYPRPSKNCQLDFTKEDDVCVRGLECLADEFVSMHRRRIRQLSLTAVFAFQNLTSNKGDFLF